MTARREKNRRKVEQGPQDTSSKLALLREAAAVK